MEFPAGLRYTKEHEWIRVEGNQSYVGITDYAQQELGDVVYVELPDAGGTVRYMESFGVVESVKAVSDLIAPLSGEVLEVNQQVVDEPEKVNEDPYGEGWLVRIRLSDATEVDALLDAGGYQQLLGEQ